MRIKCKECPKYQPYNVRMGFCLRRPGLTENTFVIVSPNDICYQEVDKDEYIQKVMERNRRRTK
jgi:hypothetical protein